MICSHGVTDEIHGRAVMIYSPPWADDMQSRCDW